MIRIKGRKVKVECKNKVEAICDLLIMCGIILDIFSDDFFKNEKSGSPVLIVRDLIENIKKPMREYLNFHECLNGF